MSVMHRVLPFIGIFLAAGCSSLYEDVSDCGLNNKENTTLVFKYTDAKGNNTFPSEISSVDAYVFDEAKKFVEHKRLESSELTQFAGWKLHLSPGDYYVVCWGNVGSNSRTNDLVKGSTTFDECYIQIPASVTSTGNPLYYAPSKMHPQARSSALQTRAIDPSMQSWGFHVEAQQENVKEMDFVCAHRTINVYIIGYPGSSIQPATVTGTQLCAEYDFYYATRNVFRNFTQQTQPVTTTEGAALLATFFVGFSEVTEGMNFILRQGDEGVILETVNLKKFLEEYPEAYGNTIDILIRFTELGMTVTVPGWGDVPVTPK